MMAMVMMRTIVMIRTMVSMMMTMMMITGRRSNEAAMKYTARNRTHRSSGLSERLVLLSSSSSSPSSLLSLLLSSLLSLLLRKWCPAVVVVVAVMAMTVSFVRGDSVHQRDIDRLCGRNPPAPHIVGGRAASLLLRKNPRTFPFPCVVTQTIETESGRTRAGRTRLYIKLNQLAIQRAADGSCYHSLSIYGVRKAHTNATDAADVQVTLCGSLANLQQSEFESLDFDIDVVWNTTNNSDPALSAISLRESNFKMVVTAFRQVDPVSNECPSVTDPRRPDASVVWHRCANHRCIDARLRCNKFNNCGDSVASDELNCPPTKFSLPAVWPLIAVPVVSVLLLTGIIGVMYYRLDRTGC